MDFFRWGDEADEGSAGQTRPEVDTWIYRVVYPGGVAVRLGPSLDSPVTEAVLEVGQEFAATKSLRMDGINYVKLADGSGW